MSTPVQARTLARRRFPAAIFMAAQGAVLASPQAARADETEGVTPIGISLVSPAQLFSSKTRATTGLDLNVIYGNSGAVYGVAGGLIHFTEGNFFGVDAQGLVGATKDMAGLSFGGLIGLSKTLRGLQVDGIVSVTGLDAKPEQSSMAIQIAGVATVADNGGGLQLSPLVNRISGASYTGIQVSGYNNAHASFRGLQVGLFNLDAADWTPPSDLHYAGVENTGAGFKEKYEWGKPGETKENVGTTAGVAIAPFYNRGNVWRGAQLGAAYNSVDEIAGAQIGLVNRAEEMSGLSIGIVNVATQLKGIQIGLANIVLHGPIPFLPGLNVGF